MTDPATLPATLPPGYKLATDPQENGPDYRPTVDVIDWTGHGNLGDEAAAEVLADLLPGAKIRHTRQPTAEFCILGPGSLFGVKTWLESAEQIPPSSRLAVFGTGISEHPAEWPDGMADRWREVLDRADLLAVRGPLTAKALTETVKTKTPVRVIGDLVLCHPGPAEQPKPTTEGKILINAAADLGGKRGAKILALLAGLVDTIQASGREVVYLPFRTTELAQARRLIQSTGIACLPPDLPAVWAAIDQAAAVVSLRLHGAILAARLGRPFVSLAYNAKHWDAARHLGTDFFTVSADRIQEADLCRILDHAIEDGTAGRFLELYHQKVRPAAEAIEDAAADLAAYWHFSA